MSVQSEIIALLKSNENIVQYVGDDIHFIQASQEESSAYVVFNFVKEPVISKDGIAYFLNTLITEVFAKNYGLAYVVENEIITTFTNYTGSQNSLIQKVEYRSSEQNKNIETKNFNIIIKSSLTIKN